MKSYVNSTPVARSIPFDGSGTTMAASDVNSAIVELSTSAAVSASPGFTWGRSGTVTAGTYLLNDTVPSNVSGRICTVNGNLTDVFISTELAAPFTLEIQKRSGNTFVTLATIVVPNVRTYVVSNLSVPVAKNDEIAVMTVSGNIKNPVVGVILKGSV